MRPPAKVAPSSQISSEAREAALYIVELADELRNLAEGQQLDFLVYLLGLVVEEAEAAGHAPAPRHTTN